MQKSIVFLMPLGVAVWTKFNRFWFQNEAKLGPKWHQKSMWTSIGDFSKNIVFSNEEQDFWEQDTLSNQEGSTDSVQSKFETLSINILKKCANCGISCANAQSKLDWLGELIHFVESTATWELLFPAICPTRRTDSMRTIFWSLLFTYAQVSPLVLQI